VIDSTASEKSFEHTEIVNENRHDAGEGTHTDRNDEHQCAPQRRSASWARGGGIGQTLCESIRSFQYAETAAQVIIVVVAVVTIDMLSARIRKHLV
jgi:hypothetical protein